MADSYDNNDCYTPQEWYQASPSIGKRFLYFKVTSTQTTEGNIDRQDHYINVTERNIAYRVKIDWNECFWTNSPQDSIGGGYWAEEFHYVKNPNSDYLSAVLFIDLGYGTYCNSSIGTGNRSTGDWSTPNGYDFSVIGHFNRVKNANGEIILVSGGATLLRKNRNTGVISQVWENTDNGKDGTYSGGAHVWTNYQVSAIMYDVDSNSEVPDMPELTIPTTHAFMRNEETTMSLLNDSMPATLKPDNEHINLASWYRNTEDGITSGLLPENLSWGQPYPYSKWYRDRSGKLTNRGLPEILEGINGYIGNQKLVRIDVGDIPVTNAFVGNLPV